VEESSKECLILCMGTLVLTVHLSEEEESIKISRVANLIPSTATVPSQTLPSNLNNLPLNLKAETTPTITSTSSINPTTRSILSSSILPLLPFLNSPSTPSLGLPTQTQVSPPHHLNPLFSRVETQVKPNLNNLSSLLLLTNPTLFLPRRLERFPTQRSRSGRISKGRVVGSMERVILRGRRTGGMEGWGWEWGWGCRGMGVREGIAMEVGRVGLVEVEVEEGLELVRMGRDIILREEGRTVG